MPIGNGVVPIGMGERTTFQAVGQTGNCQDAFATADRHGKG